MNKRLIVTTFLSATVPMLLGMADYNNALDAQQRGDFTTAVNVWQHLASAGDPVAQYNLGMMYQHGQGVKSDMGTAQRWFTRAARQGFAEAYQQLNTRSVQPNQETPHKMVTLATIAATPQAVAATRDSLPGKWLVTQSTENYTVQLVTSTNEEIIQQYYNENNLHGKAGYFRSRRQGQYWYSLVYGSFATVAEASVAVEQLPVGLKKWSPWIRNISEVKNIMR
jgi:septal ring-binding cell division protein DamX